ncbi:MAG: hypothetical protein ABI175_24785, partial [Polyangiales bacterium]
RPSSHSLSNAIAGLGDASSDGGNNINDDDEIPADKTRIESNPLDRLAEMEAANRPTPMPAKPSPRAMPDAATPRPQAAHAATPQTQPTVALRRDPAQPGKQIMPPSGPLPLPAPPSGPVAAPAAAAPSKPSTPPAGFPNFSHLPTMIAEPEPATMDQPVDVANARTELGGRLVDPNHGAQNGASPMANKATQQRNAQPDPNAAAPSGYPVMSPEMSAQIARGGDIFPSAPAGRTSGAAMPIQAPPPTNPPPMGQQMNAPMQHQPLRPSAQPYPQQPPQQHSQPYPQQHDNSGQHHAHLMSPVGQQYPQQVNWADAAAMPARAIPKWILVALFVGAIFAALILTVVIAKIAR